VEWDVMKEMRIDATYASLDRPDQKKTSSAKEEKSFGQFLDQSIKEVNRLQGEANHAIEELALGKTKNIHETMIALEKAEVSFKLMLKVRSKILEAYNEVMRMG
jgi:flagellar hook-basal body complex protein FliE